MTTMEHVVLFEAARNERASLFSRANLPLGRRGRLLMVALALLVLPVAGFAGFLSDAIVTSLSATASAGEQANILVGDGVQCERLAGPVAAACSVDAFDDDTVTLTMTEVTDASNFRLSYTVEALATNSAALEVCTPTAAGVPSDTMGVSYGALSAVQVAGSLAIASTTSSRLELDFSGQGTPIVPGESFPAIIVTAPFALAGGC